MLRLRPYLIIPLVVGVGGHCTAIWLLVLHLGLFFVTAMVCHGELARRRPPAASLTEFYLCVSLGGVLGGIFDALIAPAVFPDIWEYPLLLALSCLVRPAPGNGGVWARGADLGLPALLLRRADGVDVLPAACPPGRCSSRCRRRPSPCCNSASAGCAFALGVAACPAGRAPRRVGQHAFGDRAQFLRRLSGASGRGRRVARVPARHDGARRGICRSRPRDGSARLLQPGQSRTVPLLRHALAGRAVERVGVVGLGAGDLACYARPGQSWTFHEIDPEVERIARDTRNFHFLQRCGNDPKVVLGDARLTLNDTPDATYDVLVIDAFSSDSIPVHLLTREALALYRRKLAPDGLILLRTSATAYAPTSAPRPRRARRGCGDAGAAFDRSGAAAGFRGTAQRRGGGARAIGEQPRFPAGVFQPGRRMPPSRAAAVDPASVPISSAASSGAGPLELAEAT